MGPPSSNQDQATKSSDDTESPIQATAKKETPFYKKARAESALFQPQDSNLISSSRQQQRGPPISRPTLGFADQLHPSTFANEPSNVTNIIGTSQALVLSNTSIDSESMSRNFEKPTEDNKDKRSRQELRQSHPATVSTPLQPLPKRPTQHQGLSRRKRRKLSIQATQYAPFWPTGEQQLLDAIQTALDWIPAPQSLPFFSFKFTEKAAKWNDKVLAEFNWDLDRAIMSDPNSPLHPGSEWRPVELLDPIFSWHPAWASARKWMYQGASYPLKPIPENIRQLGITAALEYGNHKSSSTHSKFLVAELTKEVTNGWQLPLTISALRRLKDSFVSPMGVQEQFKLNPDGSRTLAKRATHDLSFAENRDWSINSRVKKDELDPLVYGFSFSRFFHLIVTYRRLYPDTPLLLSKSDVKAAFRRLQTRGDLASQSAITTKGLGALEDQTEEQAIALCALRLTFGGAPNPAYFCVMSEAATDLSNAISSCTSWNPTQLASRHAATAQAPPQLEPYEVPFAQARPLRVDVHAPETGAAEVFVDDIFSVFPWLPGKKPDHMAQAVLLAIDVLCRTPSDADSLPRQDLLSLAKAIAEGTPSEQLIILGWLLNSRTLMASLPYDKYVAWSSDIQQILDAKKPTKLKMWKTLVGRLQNAAMILQPARHFLSRLRRAELRAETHREGTLPNVEEREDLKLWLDYLKRSSEGVSLNLLTFRTPDVAHRGDASEFQLGGWNVNSGRAWRFHIPPKLRKRKSINFLEFLASGIELFLAIEEGELKPGDAFLSGTDNTTARGWMHKSNFAEGGEQHAHLDLARSMARASLDNDIALISQWWCGTSNTIADILSRDVEPSDDLLTRKILADYPSQVPTSFKISPLPEKITSAIFYWLLLEPPTTASPKALTPKETPPGVVGSNFYKQPASWIIPTSGDSLQANAIVSSAPLPKPFANVDGATLQKETNSLLPELASVPSAMWQRPFWQPENATHDSTLQEKFANFYNIYKEDTRTATPLQDTKKPSHLP